MAAAHQSTPPPVAYPRAVLLGDSITQLSFGAEGGWGAAVADRYQRRLDVLNRGYSGYTTRWMRQLVDNDVALRSVLEDAAATKLVVIFFGANDASLAEHNARQHVPLAEYADNLRALVARVAHTTPKVLVCPPPVGHAQRLAYQRERYGAAATGVLERTNESAGRYAAACEAVARDLGVPCLNLWSLMQASSEEWSASEESSSSDHWTAYLSDGLHLSPAGNRFVASNLLRLIDAEFPGLRVVPCPHTGNCGTSGATSPLPMHGPLHDALGPEGM